MTTTTKLGLIKPELTDVADITQTNRNWDIIDGEIARIDGEKTTIEEMIGDIAEDLETNNNTFGSHMTNKNNPHGVTSQQIGAAPAYSYGTTELTPGTSALETGVLYFVYE